jgi:myo-inositol-1-phosphate synthase
MSKRRLGLWLIGAKGGVATTSLVGLAALKKGLTGNQGLLSTCPPFNALGLVGWEEIVVGGHDIRQSSLYEEAVKLAKVSHAIDLDLIKQCKGDLDKFEKNFRPGVLYNSGEMIRSLADDGVKRDKETARGVIDKVQADLKEFATKNKLDQVVVLNVASTEPPIDADALPEKWSALAKLIDKPKCPLPASTLYAIATLQLGYSYVNFTPSLGSALPALDELAIANDACHMGHDGKTGETLLKSVLAPMFARRNLEIMSWVGHNIFGNMDGKVLNDPANKATKVKSKDRLLGKMLGYSPQTLVSIEYIESLGDWKTAWDHIHFKGFLGTPMILTFTWQGCDSLLAAPLVLDLVRFTERAHRAGERGLLPFLSCFFKSPLGTEENNFERQYQMLENWAAKIAAKD